MKILTQSKTAIAMLTANISNKNNRATAALTVSLAPIEMNNQSRVQILPDGYFAAPDGRPDDVIGGKWLMDAQAFAYLKASANARSNDYHFDYEHQTMLSEENGQPAPAAGWFKDLEYVPGEGLFVNNVSWTPKAKQQVKDKEYRYSSAVFEYDTTTGRPVALKHVALTNDPAIDGMKAIAALTRVNPKNNLTGKSAATTGEIPMNEALKLMLDLLGIAHTDDDLSNTAALTAIQDKAKVTIAALKSKADRTGQLEKDLNTAQTSVTALKAQATTANGAVDLSQFVPVETYNAAITQVASLKAKGDNNSIDQLLKDNSDKVFEAEIGYLTDFGKQQGFAALKAMVDSRPAIAALKTTQTKGKEKPGDTNTAALTSEQKYTADQLGLSHKDYLAQLNKETK